MTYHLLGLDDERRRGAADRDCIPGGADPAKLPPLPGRPCVRVIMEESFTFSSHCAPGEQCLEHEEEPLETIDPSARRCVWNGRMIHTRSASGQVLRTRWFRDSPVSGLSNVLGVSCTAGPAWLRQSGAAAAADDVRSTEWRTAAAVTP